MVYEGLKSPVTPVLEEIERSQHHDALRGRSRKASFKMWRADELGGIRTKYPNEARTEVPLGT